MGPTLVFIAPQWNSELEELIQITKNSYQVKVLTQKQSIDFSDPYVEVLQCFESFSPLEITRLVPWLIQLSSPQFHLLLSTTTNSRQLAGLGALMSLVRALPQSYLTHSPWPLKSWSFSLWIKAFQSLFDHSLFNYGNHFLTSHSDNASTKTESSREKSNSSETSALWDTQPSVDGFYGDTHPVALYSNLWVFPTPDVTGTGWQVLAHLILRRIENRIELWNWDQLSTRNKNIIRQQYRQVWSQFKPRSPRWRLNDWSQVKFLVLIDDSSLPLGEKDLLDLILLYQINIIMSERIRRQLKGPWKENDTFWMWHPSFKDHENPPWNNPYSSLPLTSLGELNTFRDQISNEVLRSLSKQ